MADPKNTEDQELSLDQLKDAAGGSMGSTVVQEATKSTNKRKKTEEMPAFRDPESDGVIDKVEGEQAWNAMPSPSQ